MSKSTTKQKRESAGSGANTYHHGDLRAALLDAAEAVLEENGIEGFSLRAVAKRAGVSHAAPAHHFKDAAGLLTALATVGYEKFMASQDARQAKAQGSGDNLIASGLGYVDFALAHPALFRLMFSSNRTDYQNEDLLRVSTTAFDRLVDDVAAFRGSDPHTDEEAMIDVMAAWSLVHGLADLINAGRPRILLDMPKAKREKVIKAIIGRLY